MAEKFGWVDPVGDRHSALENSVDVTAQKFTLSTSKSASWGESEH